MKLKDLNGRKFGKWLVISRSENRKSGVCWLCRCECGEEKSVYAMHLCSGNSVSCRKCSEHKCKGLLTSRMWHRVKRNAQITNREFGLGDNSKEGRKRLYDLLIIKQNSRCALSGLPIHVATTNISDTHGGSSASLDRIDSSKGYTWDNIQWVHKWINAMKTDFNQNDFITLCEFVCRYKLEGLVPQEQKFGKRMTCNRIFN